MKISHVSVAVREPERAARALAEIWGRRAHPFFPLAGAWMAFSSEEPSSQVEFYPDRTELEPIDARDGASSRQATESCPRRRSPSRHRSRGIWPGRLPRPCRKGC
jgi:hypothetical protein